MAEPVTPQSTICGVCEKEINNHTEINVIEVIFKGNGIEGNKPKTWVPIHGLVDERRGGVETLCHEKATSGETKYGNIEVVDLLMENYEALLRGETPNGYEWVSKQ